MSSLQRFVAVDQDVLVVNSEECLCLIFYLLQNTARSRPFKLGKNKEMCVGLVMYVCSLSIFFSVIGDLGAFIPLAFLLATCNW